MVLVLEVFCVDVGVVISVVVLEVFTWHVVVAVFFAVVIRVSVVFAAVGPWPQFSPPSPDRLQ